MHVKWQDQDFHVAKKCTAGVNPSPLVYALHTCENVENVEPPLLISISLYFSSQCRASNTLVIKRLGVLTFYSSEPLIASDM